MLGALLLRHRLYAGFTGEVDMTWPMRQAGRIPESRLWTQHAAGIVGRTGNCWRG